MEGKETVPPWGMQGGSGKWRKRSPPTPTCGLGTPQCPPNIAPLRGPRGGLWKSPAHPLPGKFSGVTPAPLSLRLPSPAQGQRQRGQRAGGARSRDPRAAGRRPTRSSPGHPCGAQTGGGGRGAVTGVRVSGVPTALVKCSALPLPASTVRDGRSIICRGTPAPRHPMAPTPPGTRASGPPTPASKPEEARGALLTPH